MKESQWTFPDVREQEKQLRSATISRIEHLRAALALADRLLALESASGYRALQEALTDMLLHRTSELLSARDDRSAAVLTGQCRELKSILALMAQTKSNRQALANELAVEENALRDLERSLPRSRTPEEP
jgi:hypothetical protein